MRLNNPVRRFGCGALCAVFLLAALPLNALAEGTSAGSVYVRAKTLAEKADESGTEYSGYLFALKDSASGSLEKALDGGEAEGAGVTAVACSDGCYTADSLSDIAACVPAGDIAYIEPNYTLTLCGEVSAQSAISAVSENADDGQLSLMNVPEAWEYGLDGADEDSTYDMGGDGNAADPIVVAVVDSGLAAGHEDIDYTHVLAGYNLAAGSTDTTDTVGHGTFITGQLLSLTDNGRGVNGIASGVYVMPLKVLDSKGKTYNSTVAAAVNYAVKQRTDYDASRGAEGANICVINLSLGGPEGSAELKTAVDSAEAAGIIVICAAGNVSTDSPAAEACYPAQYAIGVGSADADGGYASYTKKLTQANGEGYENKVWVSAAGSAYTSTWSDGGYHVGSGTSFAAPEVSALAAMAVSLKNDLTAGTAYATNHAAFQALLKETASRTAETDADETLDSGQQAHYGWGIVDFKAMAETAADLAGNAGKSAAVAFRADNGAGTALTAGANGLSVSVYAWDASAGTWKTAAETASGGVYTLSIGTRYRYTVSAQGYSAVSGTFIPLTAAREVSLTLTGKAYDTVFTVLNSAGAAVSGASVSVTGPSGQALAANTDGSFATGNGTYTYTISASGYFPLSGSFTVNDAVASYPDGVNALTVSLTGDQDVCSVTFAVTGSAGDPAASVTVSDSEGKAKEVYTDGAWKLTPGTYSYTASSADYKPVSGTFAVTAADLGTRREIAVTMPDALYWVFLDITPRAAADIASVTLTDSAGNAVACYGGEKTDYELTNGTYSYAVTAEGYRPVSGTFTVSGSMLEVPVALRAENDPYDVETVYHDLADVGPSDWFYENVNYAITVGLFAGVGENRFDPYGTMTRAMAVTVIWRVCGQPAASGGTPFADVASGSWYEAAVDWAYRCGVTDGVSETAFAPDRPVTRQELAALLYRCAVYLGQDVTTGIDAAGAFPDFGQAEPYAMEALDWAYGRGLLRGDDQGLLRPAATATRAEACAVFTRFVRTSGT